jgi:malonyl-CoA O-methyltransferase
MSDFELDRRQVRHAFARAAQGYERHDALQREIQARLLERLDYYTASPDTVLDVGCGTGRGAAALRKRWRRARVIAVDLALPMLRAARRHAGLIRPFARICADAGAMPLPDRSVDVLHANLCLQWCGPPQPLFGEFARVLKPGGFLAATTFGPDTLTELRAAWAEVDATHPHVSRFLDMHDLGDAALAAGLREPVLDADRLVTRYREPRELLRELKGLGVTNADTRRVRGLTGKDRFRAMLGAYERRRRDGMIPATWEVVELHAWGAADGQPRRRADGDAIATFPIERLRGSRRP